MSVSIIIPCYNVEAFLSDTLDSVLAQTYEDWECLIINDGSSDNTETIAMKYVSLNPKMKYFKQTNSGPQVARNIAINLSTGKYILPLDADDLIHSTYLEKSIRYLEQFPETDIVYCKGVYFGDKSGEIELKKFSYKELLLQNLIFNSAVMHKNKMIECGLYDTDFKRGLEDWEFYIRYLNMNSIVYQIPEILFFYRIIPNSRNSVIIESDSLHTSIKIEIYEKHKAIYTDFFGDFISLAKKLKHVEFESEAVKKINKKLLSYKNNPLKWFFDKWVKNLFKFSITSFLFSK